MSSSDEDNGDQRTALFIVFTLIGLIVASVITFGAYRALHAGKAGAALAPAAAAPAAPAAPADTAPAADAASIKIVDGVVKFYFATGKADVAANAKESLADIAKGVTAGKRALVSGYHDASGDAATNAELAKNRAISVKASLVAAGVDEAKIELVKPASSTTSNNPAEDRRVEVKLVD